MAFDDGGQAFPRTLTVDPNGGLIEANFGMSLRDWFAGQALGAYMICCDRSFDDDKREDLPTLSEYATTAYRIADAMIAEMRRREKEASNAES